MDQAISAATENIKDLDRRNGSAGGEYIARARRRRLDLASAHGTLREHGRVYRELAEGRITLAQAEVRSRVLRRHGEILGAVEQAEQIAQMAAALEEIKAKGPLAAVGYGDGADIERQELVVVDSPVEADCGASP